MPLPKPKEQEDKDEFMNRCLEDEVANVEFPKKNQRYAFCAYRWQRYKNREN